MPYNKNHAVYKITNAKTNQYYIGVDSYFPKRLKQHQSMLRNNKHKNNYMQNSYNKYGVENFKFELLLYCDSREEMLSKEIIFIREYKSLEYGFNHTIGGEGSYGYKHSKESLEKMSSWKRIITKEWCENLSKGMKGVKKRHYKRVNHPDYSKWLGGEKHPVAKLKLEDVNNIRILYNEGETQLSLSKKFNITKIHVYYIIKNKIWMDSNYELSPKRKLHSNSNGRIPIFTNILCIEDNIIFNTVREISNHYECGHGAITNNINNLSKYAKTKYGKKSFKILTN
jgi:group I intron endonuclease